MKGETNTKSIKLKVVGYHSDAKVYVKFYKTYIFLQYFLNFDMNDFTIDKNSI